MLVLLGFIIVIAAVLGGFTMAGGHIGALLHASEVITIGGAALGALIVMCPAKVLKDLCRDVLQAFKGTPFTRAAYEDMFKMMYEFCRLARREGMLALEPHLTDPHQSNIFNKYPRIAANHHIIDFIRGALGPIVDGSVNPKQLPQLIDAELKALEHEHHAPLNALYKTADALPGFGIVAAVLGIVITMGAIDGPVEEIGHKVGAALVGTFLGILLSYGFLSPLAAKVELLGISELAYYRAIATIVQEFANDVTPKIAIELARRGLAQDVRPQQEELESMLKSLDTAA
jgi:chemotaxis protein MotA